MTALAGVFVFYDYMVQVAPSVITTQLMHTFHINAFVLGGVIATYYYAYAPMQLFAGASFDKFGTKRTLTCAILACAVGVLLIALSQSPLWVAIGRFITGGGAAFAFVGMLFLGQQWFKAEYFFWVSGIAMILVSLGAIAGMAPIAAAVGHFGWRETLRYIAFFGFPLAILIFIFVKDKKTSHYRTRQNKEPFWTSFRLGFQYLLKHKQMWGIALYAMMSWAPATAFAALWGVPFLRQKAHLSETHAALAISMIWVGVAIGSPLIGLISEKIQRRLLPLIISTLIGGVSLAALAFIPSLSLLSIHILTFLIGIGTAGQALSFCIISDLAEPRRIGITMGFNNVFVVASGAIMQPLIGGILHLWKPHYSHHVPFYPLVAYQHSMIAFVTCYVIALLICFFWLKETHCQRVN